MARCRATKSIIYPSIGQVPTGTVGDVRGTAANGTPGSYSVDWQGGLYAAPNTSHVPNIQVQDTDGDDFALTD